MAWMPLGDAVDRVLARLADQRNEKPGEVLSLTGKCARAEGEDYPARLGKLGCGGTPLPAALRRKGKGEKPHVAGRPVGQGKFRRTKL